MLRAAPLSFIVTEPFGKYVVRWVILMLVAHRFSANGVGMFSLSLLVMILVVSVASARFSKLNSNYAQAHPHLKPTLFGNSLFLSVVGGLMAAAATGVIVPNLYRGFGATMEPKLWAISVMAIPPLLLNETCSGLSKWRWGYVLSEVLLLMMLVTAQLRNVLTLEGTVSYWVLAVTMAAFIHLVHTWRSVGLDVTVDVKLWREMIAVDVLPRIEEMSTNLRFKVDLLLVAYFLTMEQVGYYALAVVMVGVASQSASVTARKLLPRLPLPAEGVIPLASRLNSATAMGWGLLSAAAAYPVLELMAGKTAAVNVYLPLLWLLGGNLFYRVGELLKGNLLIRREKLIRGISIVSLLFLCGLDILLIPRFHIVGAAVSATIVQIGSTAVLLVLYRGHFGVPIRDLMVMKSEDFR